MKKIFFNISGLAKGGAERVVSILANNFVRNYDVGILVNSCTNQSYEIDNKIKIYELDSKYVTNPISRNYYRLKNMKKIIKNEEPDVIISFLPLPSFKLLFLKPRLKCKVIVSDRNDPRNEYKKLVNKILMKFLYHRADGFVFQTNEQKEYFSKSIQNRSIVISNPLKEEFLNTAATKKENVIINVGRLTNQKNQKLLVDSFAEIVDSFPDYTLKIFGDGDLKNELQEYIDKLGLHDKAFLCGISDNINDELQRAKVFVLSSNYEGMPNSLMEAMASGLACISSDCPCGGPRELIVDGKNGLLFNVNDKRMLSDKLTKVLSNQSFANLLGKNAEEIKVVLHPNAICEKWLEYIEKIVK